MLQLRWKYWHSRTANPHKTLKHCVTHVRGPPQTPATHIYFESQIYFWDSVAYFDNLYRATLESGLVEWVSTNRPTSRFSPTRQIENIRTRKTQPCTRTAPDTSVTVNEWPSDPRHRCLGRPDKVHPVLKETGQYHETDWIFASLP